MRGKIIKRYEFPKDNGPWGGFEKDGETPITLTSIAIQQTDGADEETASKEADAADEPFEQVLIKMAIVAVNDTALSDAERPWTKFDLLNSKTRALIGRAFQRLNLATKDDEEDFFSTESSWSPSSTTKTETASTPA